MTTTGVRDPRGLGVFAAVLLSVLTLGPAAAQQAAPNPYTDLSPYIVSGDQVVPRQALTTAPATAGLSSTVVQSGQGNVASAALTGTGNFTTQYQNGANNSSTLNINGVQNTVTTSQIGSSNTTAIDVAGNGNSISNLQVGSGLSYQLQVVGKAAPVSVQQYGKK
jgi:hypothetical protein